MIVRKYMTAATVSWIDPATGLPETDTQPIVSPTINRGFLVGNQGFRFTNFLEVYADLNMKTKRIVAYGFTAASGTYRGPSFLHIPSHAFLADRSANLPLVYAEGQDCVKFSQTVGARTVSPEILGGLGGAAAGAAAGAAVGTFIFPAVGTALGAITGSAIGALSGEIAGHQFVGFPPIWTTIEIDLPFAGIPIARLLYHSIFPSVTFYVQKSEALARPFAEPLKMSPVNDTGASYYRATKDVELPAWRSRGWGKINRGGFGPNSGNPWNIDKDVVGLATSYPN